jgi:hypothetical protein
MKKEMNNFLFDVDENVIENIKNLRLNQKTYSEISKLINISEDKLIKICRNLKLNKSSNTITKVFNKLEILNYYLNVKSLRKTAKYFNTTRDTIRKYIDDDKIINTRVKTKSRSQHVIDWRKRKKIELIKYKGGCCVYCGYKKSVAALQFHHLDPTKKDFSISSKSYSIERLKKEVDKCILICANCHIELHENLKASVAPM